MVLVESDSCYSVRMRFMAENTMLNYRQSQGLIQGKIAKVKEPLGYNSYESKKTTRTSSNCMTLVLQELEDMQLKIVQL